MKKKRRFNGNDVAANNRAESEMMKQREQTQQFYIIQRTIFELWCVELGIQEHAILNMGEGGIVPGIALKAFPESEKDRWRIYLERKLLDAVIMSGNKENLIPFIQQTEANLEALLKEHDEKLAAQDKTANPILGADGVPIPAKAQDQKNEGLATQN